MQLPSCLLFSPTPFTGQIAWGVDCCSADFYEIPVFITVFATETYPEPELYNFSFHLHLGFPSDCFTHDFQRSGTVD